MTKFQGDSTQVKADLAEAVLFEPEAVSFSIETPGWPILFGVLILLFLIGLWRYWAYFKRTAYRRDAIKALNSAEGSGDVSQAFLLLKKVAIATYGREEVAQLNGKVWINFLDSSVPDINWKALSPKVEAYLYQNKEIDKETRNQIFQNSREWVKRHA